MTSFGNLLRKYRLKSRDYKTGKPLSSDKFAESIYEEVGLDYAGSTIRNWELDKTQIEKGNRRLLVGILCVFVKCKSISSLDEANALLEAGDFRSLSPEEVVQINADWSTRTGDPVKETRPRTLAHPIGDTHPKTPFMSPRLPPQGVIGREKLVTAMIERLASQSPDGETNVFGMLGFGGIGKTTLAIALAHHRTIGDLFPDGVFWAALGPNPQTRYLLEQWGHEIGLDLILERSELDCSRRLTSAMHSLRALFIVDDVWDANQGELFLLAGPNSRLIFTTREIETANLLTIKKKQFRVDFLDERNSLALLERLAPQLVSTDKESARALCRRLGYLPLAITLAGRLLANESDVPGKMKRVLSELLEHHQARLNLIQHEGRLGVDEDHPVSLQAVLGMSVDRLEAADKERFAMLAVFGGEPLSWEVSEAQYVWQCTREAAEDTIHNLLSRGLVEINKSGEYSMHALLADYAQELRVAFKL